MASNEVLLGTFTDVGGEVFEVYAKGDVAVLRGDQGSTVVLGRAARSALHELLELLDRAAMPGRVSGG